ncbi:MAG: S-layer homology domain-containing protein [Clostridia bacterium]|nr:S-layer homology domain-containing protein [Clostridia bacterium]
MKKFTSILTALIMMLSLCLGSVAYAEDSDVKVYEPSPEFDMMLKLGVFDADASADKPVTRGAILVPVLRLAGLGEPSAIGDTGFADVPQNHKYAPYVYAAENAGFINGNGMGSYHPDDNADFNAAVKLMVSVIGFASMAEAKGGYPTGYMSVANSKKMLLGITADDMQSLTYDVFARLIANSLEVYTAESTYVENGEVYNVEGDDMLLHRLGLEKIEGIVTQNEYTSLTAPTGYDEAYAVVGGVAVNPEGSDLGKYLGYNVAAYVDEEGTGRNKNVKYVYPEYNDVLTVAAEDIIDISVDKATFEYETTNKIKTEKLEKYFTFIYNGLACSEYNDKLLNSGYGNTAFIDNDDDGTYDVVSVEAYYDVVVHEVTGGVISNKLGSGIDLNDNSITYTISKNGSQIAAEGLIEWDSILVVDSNYNLEYPNSQRVLAMYVSDNRAMGKVSEKYEENGRTYLTIEGSEFEISKSLLESKSLAANVPDLGSEGTFVINTAGKIVSFSVSSLQRATAQYGYLTGVASEGSLSKKTRFKLYTLNQQFEIFDAADSVTVDGDNYKNEDAAGALTAGGFEPQLVCYRLNSDGKLSYIDTSKKGDKESGYTLNITYDGRNQGLLTYKSGYQTFADRVHLSGNTLIFCVPVDDADDENLYGLSNHTTFKNDQRYEIQAYNTDEASLACGALVYRGDVSQQMEETNLCIIDRIYSALDADGNTAEFLKGFDGYGEVLLNSKSNEFTKAGLATGDIINYSSNAKSEMVDHVLVYDCSEDYFAYDSNPSGDFSAQYRKMYGLVYYKNGTKFRICTGDPNEVTDISSLEIKDFKQFRNAYTYDLEEETVTKTDTNDLVDWLSVGDDCTRVIISQGYGDNASIILYK